MLYKASCVRLLTIALLLLVGQRMVSIAFLADDGVHAALRDVILVAIVVLTSLLRPAGINILVAALVRLALLLLARVALLCLPKATTVALLDLPVLLIGVVLAGSFHESGIDNLALVERQHLFVNECNCRGKQEHETQSDVMQHFNDWLKYKIDPRRKKEKKNDGEGIHDVPPDYRKRWLKCHAELCQSVSPEEASKTFSLMRFESFDPQAAKLIVQVPTNDVFERLEKDHVKTIGKFIAKYFGKARLAYSVLKSG